MSYNLLDQSWLPVEWSPDSAKSTEPTVGIRNALFRAHEIKCISHTAPFIEFGLYRLLITIVLDAYIVAGQRPTLGKMRSLLDKKRFDTTVIDDYLNRYKPGFDLWDTESPFLQSKRAEAAGKEPKPKPIVSMFPAIPSGINLTHWHHYMEGETNLCEAVVAQLLATVSPFNFKTKPGEARTLVGDPPLYAIALGKNLFETIVLNLPRPSGRVTVEQEKKNGPAWRTRLDITKLPKVPTIAQGFTWPVRVIELLKKNGPMVAEAYNKAAYVKPTAKAKEKGKNFYDAKYGWRDPNAGVEVGGDSLTHITVRLDIPIWQDLVPLFLVAGEGEALRAEKRRTRPEVISNALRVLDTPQFRVVVYGMRKKGGGGGDVKVEAWFRSVLTIPTEVARDTRLSGRALNAFNTTQKIAETLQKGLRMLRSPFAAKRTASRDVQREERNALTVFWQSMEPVLSYEYLDALECNDLKAEEELWDKVLKQAREAFDGATGPQRRTADGLFRIANASNWFERKLQEIIEKRGSHE